MRWRKSCTDCTLSCRHNMEIRENEFDADAFMLLWNAVWDGCPSREQVTAALAHSIYRAAVYDGNRIVGMARMIGDMGLCYYIKDVIVRPAYQGQGIGRKLVETCIQKLKDDMKPGYIKDVIVHPDYQGRGVGRMLIETMLTFIRTHGVPGTDIAVELCAMPDKMAFYEKFGFAANEAQRMRLMCRAEEMT